MLTVRRCDDVPDAGPELDVRRVGPMMSVTVTFLCIHLRGFWTHWNEGRHRTQPCTDPVESCAGHRSKLPLRWKAYAHSYDHDQHDQCLLEMTPGAARQVKRALQAHESLRGLRVKVTRGKGPKARLSVSVQKLPDPRELHKLPAEHDALITLSKLWGFALENPPEFPEADLIPTE